VRLAQATVPGRTQCRPTPLQAEPSSRAIAVDPGCADEVTRPPAGHRLLKDASPPTSGTAPAGRREFEKGARCLREEERPLLIKNDSRSPKHGREGVGKFFDDSNRVGGSGLPGAPGYRGNIGGEKYKGRSGPSGLGPGRLANCRHCGAH